MNENQEYLQNLINQNKSIIENNKKKIIGLNFSTKEHKIAKIFSTSIFFGYTPILLISLFLNLTNIAYFPLYLLGGSLSVGVVTNSIINKIFKLNKPRKQLNLTEEKIVEEKFKLELENEKLKNKNSALEQAFYKDKAYRELHQKAMSSKRYAFIENTYTKDELIHQKEVIEKNLEENNNVLDELSRKQYLTKKRTFNRLDASFYSMMTGVLTLICTFLPTMEAVFNGLNLASPQSVFISTFSIPVISTFISGVFYSKKIKREKRVLKALGKIDFKTENDYSNEISKTIDEIAISYVELLDNKRELKKLERAQVEEKTTASYDKQNEFEVNLKSEIYEETPIDMGTNAPTGPTLVKRRKN